MGVEDDFRGWLFCILGEISLSVAYYSGGLLKETPHLSPHYYVVAFTFPICIIGTVAPYFYGLHYLKKHHSHSLRNQLEKGHLKYSTECIYCTGNKPWIPQRSCSDDSWFHFLKSISNFVNSLIRFKRDGNRFYINILIVRYFLLLKKNMKTKFLLVVLLSALSEGVDKAKNMINMKSVLLTAIIIFLLPFITILIHYQSLEGVPLSMLMSVTVFTLFLVKFSQNEKIKEFFFRKLNQKKTQVVENFQNLKVSTFKIKINKVSVQENITA